MTLLALCIISNTSGRNMIILAIMRGDYYVKNATCQAANKNCNTNSISLANFVGVVVGFLNVLPIRLVASA
jgi:hypothetical protein